MIALFRPLATREPVEVPVPATEAAEDQPIAAEVSEPAKEIA